jgi:hypothetical protein
MRAKRIESLKILSHPKVLFFSSRSIMKGKVNRVQENIKKEMR